MLKYAAFSALRLAKVFPPALLGSYPFYTEVDPEGDFDTEYQGGQWHEESIDGVQFWYPAAAGDQLGGVDVWACAYLTSGPVRDKPDAKARAFVDAWRANADRVLEALDLPVRMGAKQAAVRALAAGKVMSSPFPDEWYAHVKAATKGTLSSHYFACRAPEVYHVKAVTHASEGLLTLEIRRPDLIRANDREGGYDMCFAALYDEGPTKGRRGKSP